MQLAIQSIDSPPYNLKSSFVNPYTKGEIIEMKHLSAYKSMQNCARVGLPYDGP